MTAGLADPVSTASRLRLRGDVSAAARIVAPLWPIDTFIAVNPLGGLEDQPFGEAIARAGQFYGASGTLDEPTFRQFHAAGRITTGDLLQALARRHPAAYSYPAIGLAGQLVSATRLLMTDLLYGVPALPPSRLVRTRSELCDPAVAQAIDSQTAKWCAAFCDGDQATWTMPGREHGFYSAWRALAWRDRSLPAPVRRALHQLPDHPEDAVLAAFAALGITFAERHDYLQAHLTQLPGWAAHMKWQADHGSRDALLDYVALRLSYEAAWLSNPADYPPAAGTTPTPPQTGVDVISRTRRVAWMLGITDATETDITGASDILQMLPVPGRALIWLDAYESHYRDQLLNRLSQNLTAEPIERAAAQFVCCIDVRSEGLRRHLEAAGNYQTLGFAGFFAVALRYQQLAGGKPDSLCPVLLDARNPVAEVPVPGAEQHAAHYLAGLQTLTGAEDAFHAAKDHPLAPFALAEAAGWIAGPLAAGKTFFAGTYHQLRRRLLTRVAPIPATMLTVDDGFSLDEQVLFAETALTMMGLRTHFSRLTVLCGHGATTENNPYAAALDCGACGGHRGGPNARAAAGILNKNDVRRELARRGIVIPDDTHFLAAEHDTATDRITLLDTHFLPISHLDDATRLTADLTTASSALSVERCRTLPGAPARPRPATAARHTRTRSSDWSQVFPEWGLAGNAAFIIGPRQLTAGLCLDRRVFLHSYDGHADPEGTALETILTAPLIVAQWINSQYYFSTVAPDVFGAGTKTIHNVVSGIGILAGHNGDLKLGLPTQSVSCGQQLAHEPMRLLTVAQAPLARIDAIIGRNTILQHLLGHEWIHLAARETAAQPWQRHTQHGWQPWTTTTKEPTR